MRTLQATWLLALAGVGCDFSASGAPERPAAADPRHDPPPRAAARSTPSASRGRTAITRDEPTVPRRTLDAIAADALCVTRGKLTQTARIDVPTFRAVAPGHAGDAAAVRVRVNGRTEHTRALASGQERRQVGLKLRAQDGCNLVYVMWRLDPKPKLDVSVKRNPGQRTAKECGADGYTKVKPITATKHLPDLLDGTEHELRAEISGDRLLAWVDDQQVWQGTLPDGAADLTGPAGVRSDNLDIELVSLAVEKRAGGDVAPKCVGDEASD